MTIHDENQENTPDSAFIKQYTEMVKQKKQVKGHLLRLNEIIERETEELLRSAQAINNVLDSFLVYVKVLSKRFDQQKETEEKEHQKISTVPLINVDLRTELEELRVVRELVAADYQQKQKSLEEREIAIQTITDMIQLMTAKRYRFIGEIASLMNRIKDLEEQSRIYYGILYLQEKDAPFQLRTVETYLTDSFRK